MVHMNKCQMCNANSFSRKTWIADDSSFDVNNSNIAYLCKYCQANYRIERSKWLENFKKEQETAYQKQLEDDYHEVYRASLAIKKKDVIDIIIENLV